MNVSTIDLSPPLRFVDDVTAALRDWKRSGLGGVLATLVGIDGASPRPLGSQIAVSEHGDFVGQISSDCAEAAIAREALAVLAQEQACTVRYGRGSRYMDVRLPCGSGLDIHFDPCVPLEALEALEIARRERRPAALHAPWHQGRHAVTHGRHADASSPVPPRADRLLETDETGFIRHYLPRTRIVVAGRGAHASSLIGLAQALGWEVCLATSDQTLHGQHLSTCRTAIRLAKPNDFDASLIDPWTATVTLFHDHDWEPPILARALAAGGFYVGALGSRAAHERRRQALAALGIDARQIARVRGPVGLDIGASSPPEIALSIAAQIIATRNGR